MDDTRHITLDQWEDILSQLEDAVDLSSKIGPEDIDTSKYEVLKDCAKTILDILCLEKPDEVD
jgi:hypothetical protein